MKKFLPQQRPSIALKLSLVIFLVGMVNFMGNSQIAPVITPSGGFAIDGDMQSNYPINGIGDWIFGTTGAGSYVLNIDGSPVNSSKTFVFEDLYNNQADNTFQGGLKWNDDPNTWTWLNKKAGGKGDINHVYIHLSEDIENNQWLIIASDRLDITGASYTDFEFLQGNISANANGTFSSSGPHGGRTVNDVLITVEYPNGGSASVVRFYVWRLVGSNYEYVLETPPPTAFAQPNTVLINNPIGAFGTNQYLPYQFVEAAINVSAFFTGLSDPCLGLTVSNVLVKSKSSPALTADLNDFVTPISAKIVLGTAEIHYNNDEPICTTDENITPEILGVQGGTFSSSPAGLSIDSITGIIDVTSSLVGTYTVTYSYEAVEGCPKTATTTITVTPEPLPIVTNVTICSDEEYTWSVNGVTYLGSAGSTSVNLEGADCAADTTLNVTVTPEPQPIVTNVTIRADEEYTWSVNGVTYLGSAGSTSVNLEGASCAPDSILNITVTQGITIIAVDDEFKIFMNEQAEGSIIVNDINPIGNIVITTTPVVSPLNGDVTINPDGTMVYTPDAGYSGIDSFTYRICNSIVPTLCDEAVVTIYITEIDTITPPPLSTCEEFIPNGFSPNDDGINDLFEIIQVPVEGDTGDGICEDFYIRFPSARIEIYNRWGNLVYEKEGYGNLDQWGPTEAWWNGRSTNGWTVGGDKLPSATYFYILYFNNGGKEPKAGTIFLNN